jgi:hypothetical protein
MPILCVTISDAASLEFQIANIDRYICKYDNAMEAGELLLLIGQ